MLKLGQILSTHVTSVNDLAVMSFRSDKYKMNCADPPIQSIRHSSQASWHLQGFYEKEEGPCE